MLDRIREKREEIYAIARRNHAEKVWLFGSCARREERPESDVDFLVDFESNATLFDHAGLEYELAELLSHKVDVVAQKAITSGTRFAQEVEKERIAV